MKAEGGHFALRDPLARIARRQALQPRPPNLQHKNIVRKIPTNKKSQRGAQISTHTCSWSNNCRGVDDKISAVDGDLVVGLVSQQIKTEAQGRNYFPKILQMRSAL
jgi:hypothetical protein